MKASMMFLAAAWLWAAADACGVKPSVRAEDRAGQAVMAGANNEFALALYGRLACEPGNVFFSPNSIHAALTMTYAGADGLTAEQMYSVLCLPRNEKHLVGPGAAQSGDAWVRPPQDRTHAAYKAFLAALAPGKDAGYRLTVANALWGQKGKTWLPAFLKTTKDSYGAGLQEVDFAGDTEAARKTINDWVEKQTQEKIKDLLAPGILTPLTRLVLTNAIYFKGNWAEQFDKKLTRDAPFHVAADKTVQAPLMCRQGHFGYAGDPAVQVLSMPYKGNELSMVVLLPKAVDGLGALEKSLTAEKLAGYLAAARKQQVRVFLPRFKVSCQFGLGKTLAAMGMSDAFSRAADFSGMDGTKDLYISAVVHKAFVEVNEEGTEAAAATGVVMGRKSLAVGEPPIPVFRADHPFLYMIRHNATGAILFMGRLSDPKG